jgi:hypothetical protein
MVLVRKEDHLFDTLREFEISLSGNVLIYCEKDLSMFPIPFLISTYFFFSSIGIRKIAFAVSQRDQYLFWQDKYQVTINSAPHIAMSPYPPESAAWRTRCKDTMRSRRGHHLI